MSVSLDVQAVLRRIAQIGEVSLSPVSAPPPPFDATASSRRENEPAPRPTQAFGAHVSDAYASLVRSGARAAGVDARLVNAVIAVESRFDPSATSPAGAAGLMQLMPATAQALAVANPYDPAQNVRGGAAYLRELIDRFHGDLRLAVAAYNAGPGAVERFAGVPPYAETRAYVDRVLAAYRTRRLP